MKKIDKYIIYEILYYLSNDVLIKLLSVNKEMNSYLMNKNFRNNIINRKHPIVVNVCDNICRRCNFFDLKKYIYFNPLLKTIYCNHAF